MAAEDLVSIIRTLESLPPTNRFEFAKANRDSIISGEFRTSSERAIIMELLCKDRMFKELFSMNGYTGFVLEIAEAILRSDQELKESYFRFETLLWAINGLELINESKALLRFCEALSERVLPRVTAGIERRYVNCLFLPMRKTSHPHPGLEVLRQTIAKLLVEEYKKMPRSEQFKIANGIANSVKRNYDNYDEMLVCIQSASNVFFVDIIAQFLILTGMRFDRLDYSIECINRMIDKVKVQRVPS